MGEARSSQKPQEGRTQLDGLLDQAMGERRSRLDRWRWKQRLLMLGFGVALGLVGTVGMTVYWEARQLTLYQQQQTQPPLPTTAPSPPEGVDSQGNASPDVRSRLTQSSQQIISRAQAVQRLVVLGGLTGVGLLVLGYGFLMREIRQRHQVEQALLQLNGQLEYRVAERTLELSQSNVALQTEIRERQQVEATLKEREEQLRLALEAARMGTWNWNLQTNQIQWSRGHEQLFGLSPDSFDGTFEAFNACVHPDDRAPLQQAVQQALAARLDYEHEFRIHWPDGSLHWIVGLGRFFFDEAGTPLYMRGVVLDISDRKQAETVLKQAKEELEQRVLERTAELTQVNGQLLQALLQQQRTQQTLQESQALLSSIFEGTTDLIAALDPDFRYIAFNRAYAAEVEKIFGCSIQIGDSLMTGLAHLPIDQARAGELWGRALVGEEFTCVTELGDPQRSRNVYEMTFSSLQDAQGKQIGASHIVKDVSERIRAEQQREALLKQVEYERARLEAVLRQMPAAVFIAEAESGKITLSNDKVAEVLGDVVPELNRSELNRPELNRPESQSLDVLAFSAALHPDGTPYQSETVPLVRSLWQGETVINEEMHYRRRDGTPIVLSVYSGPIRDSQGQIMASVGAAFDITAQKQTEATLREANRRWRSLLENVHLLVVGLNSRGQVEYINPFLLQVTGYTETELLGQDWFTTLVAPEERSQMQAIFQQVLNHNLHSHHQNTILTQTGARRVIAWNNTQLKDASGRVIGTMSIGEDITEQQALERMKQDFISVVSHELRTPLTAIHGSLGLLAHGIYNQRPDKMQQMLEIAASQTDRLVRLVNDILDLSRLESDKVPLVMQTCEVKALIDQAVETMQLQAEQSQITLVVLPMLGAVWGDPDALMQTLTNLLSNAIKFSPAHTTITVGAKVVAAPCPGAISSIAADLDWEISTKLQSLPSPLHAPGVSPTAYLQFWVRDQGRGIPVDKLEKVFDKFQQVDASDAREKGGTGLGLAICRTIVHQHGGEIWVESTLGQGSTFYFTLPIAPPEQQQLAS